MEASELASSTLPVSTLAATRQRSLIVFDVNGLFIERVHKSEFRKTIMPRSHDFVTNKNLYVFVRPHTQVFLEFAFEHFDVGFWSSMTRANTYDILVRMLSRDQIDAVKIVLTQEDCSMLGDYVENTKKPIFYKVLDRLWTKAEMRPYREHVLLIDDSVYKCRFNPPHTAIHPPTFKLLHLEPEDTELLRLRGYLEGSLTAASLRAYVWDTPYDEAFQTEPKTERPIENEDGGHFGEPIVSALSNNDSPRRKSRSRISVWRCSLLWCGRYLCGTPWIPPWSGRR